MNLLFIVNALVFSFLYVIWKKSDWLNMSIKFVLFILAIANAFQAYQLLK